MLEATSRFSRSQLSVIGPVGQATTETESNSSNAKRSAVVQHVATVNEMCGANASAVQEARVHFV